MSRLYFYGYRKCLWWRVVGIFLGFQFYEDILKQIQTQKKKNIVNNDFEVSNEEIETNHCVSKFVMETSLLPNGSNIKKIGLLEKKSLNK